MAMAVASARYESEDVYRIDYRDFIRGPLLSSPSPLPSAISLDPSFHFESTNQDRFFQPIFILPIYKFFELEEKLGKQSNGSAWSIDLESFVPYIRR